MCKETLQGTRQRGTPHFGESNFVSSILTLTGKIEEKSLSTSGRRRSMDSLECAPTSLVLFSVFLMPACPSTTGAPNHAHCWPQSVLFNKLPSRRSLSLEPERCRLHQSPDKLGEGKFLQPDSQSWPDPAKGEQTRDKFRIRKTAMITGAVFGCFTFFEGDSPYVA